MSSLSIIGVGAFGAFMLGHLAPHFDILLHDNNRDLSALAHAHGASVVDLQTAAQADIVILAVPVRALEGVVLQIKDTLKAGQLVMDVASVKCMPAQILERLVPEGVDIIGLHPLFGPQSGKHGIEGLKITVVPVRGNREAGVIAFLRDNLGLDVICCTADAHDEQMAYAQGITHMVAKVFSMMDVPEIEQSTKTYTLLQAMVDTIKHDSDALFLSIQTDNPYVAKVNKKFFQSVADLKLRLDDFQTKKPA